ncbi:uncharacterized protein [Anoplolepis gracilipes]|uniref:uncharacterized protein isoform X2 n=1 Tax=Anoplolepis gracilipes TaxID=354296 RepID=UPI003B9E088D
MAEFSGDPTNKNTFDILESNNPETSRQAEEETSPSKKAEEEKPSPGKEQRIKDFIDNFNWQIKEENISHDNIYNMVKTTFKWKTAVENKIKDKKKLHVHINKFIKDQVIAIFCINATGSNKLPPYFIYQCESEKTVKYLGNYYDTMIFNSEGDKSKEIFEIWYEDCFKKCVNKYQEQKGRKSDKIILLLSDRKKISSIVDQEGSFKVMLFSTRYVDEFQPITYNTIKKLSNTFVTDVIVNGNLGLASVRQHWTNMSSENYFWNKIIKPKILESNNPEIHRQAEEKISLSKQQRIKNFINYFNRRIKEENINHDNIYSMVKTTFTWKNASENRSSTSKEGIHVNLDKLKNDELITIFCTNASLSNKLPPYFIHKYESKEIVQYLSNQHHAKILKSEKDLKNVQNIFKSWYEDFFIKHVSEHQQKARKNDPSSTSFFVNQPLKSNKNVREEDTAVEKSSEPIKKKPRRE